MKTIAYFSLKIPNDDNAAANAVAAADDDDDDDVDDDDDDDGRSRLCLVDCSSRENYSVVSLFI